MKKTINKFFTKIKTALIVISILVTIPVRSAQAIEMPSNLIDVIISVYNSTLGIYADMAYQFDPQIANYIINNKAIINSDVNSELKKSLDNETSNAFAGIQAQNKKNLSLTSIKAEDDVDLNYITTSMFGVTNDLSRQAIDAEAKKNNALFNVEYFIGPDIYKDTTAKDNATGYLEQLKNIAPSPPIIRIGSAFDVPIMNSTDPTQKAITIGQKSPLSSKELDNLRKDLLSNSDYRKYKKSYRSLIAIKNVFVDNLQYSYQIRLPQSNGKSVEQIRNEQINERLTSEYYQKMSTASPSTVNREILFVLAEISGQLNEVRRQNERIIIMNSIQALDQLSTTSLRLDNEAQKAGQFIYCKVKEYRKEKEKDPLCTSQAASAAQNIEESIPQPTTNQ
jgi:hypothetical protein